MINNYFFTQISNIDYPKIDELNRKIYGLYPELDSSYKLDSFYAKDKNLGILVKDNNNLLVCTYLVFPVLIVFNNHFFWVGQSGNTMLDEKYLGSNLVVSSGNIVYENLIKKEYYGIFGFPSKSILRTRTKGLGWTKASQINSYSFFLPTIPLFLFTRRFIFLKKLHREFIKLFINVFIKPGNNFESSNKYNFDASNSYVYRSEQFWEYKLLNKDNFLIKLHDINIVFKYDSHIYIGDIDVSRKKLSLLFFLKLFFFLIFTFNFSLKFYCSDNSTLDSYLKKYINPKKSLYYCFKNFTDKFDLSIVKFTYFDFDTF